MDEDGFISRERPAIVTLVTIGLATAGTLVLFASLPFFLTGLFAGPALLRLSGVIAGIGASSFILAWGFHVGYRWAWCGAAFLTPPLVLVARWMVQTGYWPLEYASWMLGALVILIQSAVWRGTIRRWFRGRHEEGRTDESRPRRAAR